MRPESEDPKDIYGDARDAVTGPVGRAHLVEPSTVEADAPDPDVARLMPIDDAKPVVPEDRTSPATER